MDTKEIIQEVENLRIYKNDLNSQQEKCLKCNGHLESLFHEEKCESGIHDKTIDEVVELLKELYKK